MSFTKRYANAVADVMGLDCNDSHSEECERFQTVLIGLASREHVEDHCNRCPRRIADDVMEYRNTIDRRAYCDDMQRHHSAMRKLLTFNTVSELTEFYRDATLVDKVESLIGDIRAMRRSENWYGGFGNTCLESGDVEWPNLTISTDAVDEILKKEVV